MFHLIHVFNIVQIGEGDLKRWLLLLVFSVLFYSIFLCPSVYAASSIGFESYQFSSSKIYQGNSDVYVDLQIINIGNSSFVLHGAFVHFDWQASNESFMVGSQRSDEPYDLGKELKPAEDYTIRIGFSVPLKVSEGAHLFYFKVFYNNGLEVQWNPRAKYPYAELTIYSAYETSYTDRITSIEEKVAEAEGAGFISPEARSLLRRAQDYLSDAHSYVDQGNWKSASSCLTVSSNFIDQAYEAEQRFKTYLVIGGVIGGGAVIGAGLFVRRRKKRSKKLSSKKATESS